MFAILVTVLVAVALVAVTLRGFTAPAAASGFAEGVRRRGATRVEAQGSPLIALTEQANVHAVEEHGHAGGNWFTSMWGNIRRGLFRVAPEPREEFVDDSSLFDSVADVIVEHSVAAPYEVVQNWVYVRTAPSLLADILGEKEHCSIVWGKEEAGWVNLTRENGYMKLLSHQINKQQGASPLIKRVRFVRVAGGSGCVDGYHPITNVATCKEAASYLGIDNAAIGTASDGSKKDEGCFGDASDFPTTAGRLLRAINNTPVPHSFVTVLPKPMVQEKQANDTRSGNYEEVCSSLPPCDPTPSEKDTTTITVTSTSPPDTTSTIVARTTSKPPLRKHPGLFCFMLSKNTGYEAQLTKDQCMWKSGIFRCEEHQVYTDFQPLELCRDEKPVALGSFHCKKGKWGSWANAKVFARAWKAVFDDGRWREQDWIVKVDADCVFHPDRLKLHIRASSGTTAVSPAYFKNFMDGMAIVGAIEVLNRGAMLLFEKMFHLCEESTTGAAEDYWLWKCLELVGARQKDDSQLLDHENNHPNITCSDGWMVAFHPYKDSASFHQCLDGMPVNSINPH